MDYDYNDFSKTKSLKGRTAQGSVRWQGFSIDGGWDAATCNDNLSDCDFDNISDVEHMCEVMTKINF